MTVVSLLAIGMNYGAGLVLAAVVIGVTARVGLLLRQGKRIFPHH
jgi:hypothetical protein